MVEVAEVVLGCVGYANHKECASGQLERVAFLEVEVETSPTKLLSFSQRKNKGQLNVGVARRACGIAWARQGLERLYGERVAVNLTL